MNPKEKIMEIVEGRNCILVCGIGNDIKGDDAVGPYIISQVKETGWIKTLDCGKNPEAYIKNIVEINPDLLILIDSTKFNGKPGDLIITQASEIEKKTISSHRMPIPVFNEILHERINNLDIYLIGIQPKQIILGKEISKPVKTTAKTVIEIINNIKQQ
ncbi:NiFe-hydrogenase maturation factor [Methanonatronarchaeum thermophilum]|uniref:NiFe-hydrogenase maturation factor n=1 Tax=Methanonatronarchaeum thermophilum TaxID=1927129 RepID=A0A1Y3GES4_9EURY|nr:hydrogenase maturation protease [Methanonatronarchaeum thermophilum]OUJ18803.1 NiFe-hydrogenase maturation factor [Methanonatronarchaeum thermophilum]